MGLIHIGALLGFLVSFGALMHYIGACTLVYALSFGLFLNTRLYISLGYTMARF